LVFAAFFFSDFVDDFELKSDIVIGDFIHQTESLFDGGDERIRAGEISENIRGGVQTVRNPLSEELDSSV
jgi:hypothetical protein